VDCLKLKKAQYQQFVFECKTQLRKVVSLIIVFVEEDSTKVLYDIGFVFEWMFTRLSLVNQSEKKALEEANVRAFLHPINKTIL